MMRCAPLPLLLTLALLSSACSTPPRPMPASRGESIGAGMRSFSTLIKDRKKPARDAPWEPNFLYPPLGQPGTPKLDERKTPTLLAASQASERAKDVRTKGPARASLYLLFRLYKETYSRVDGSYCTFVPSCSRFGLEAVTGYGPYGFALTLARLTRNHADLHDHYLKARKFPFRLDPVENYIFWMREPDFDVHQRYADDPAKAWYLHLELTEELAHP